MNDNITYKDLQKMCVRLMQLGITENIIFVTKKEFDEYYKSIAEIPNTFGSNAKLDLDMELPKDFLGEAQHMGCRIYFLLKP